MKASAILALAVLVGSGPAFADPPGHAPAYGYYKKRYDHDHDRRDFKNAKHY